LKAIRLKKLEPSIFVVITILNLFPVLFTTFVPTLDGACHLYNSKLMNYLLFSAPGSINDFFTFNHEPVPNYFGHILLCFFNLVFPAWFAEKSLIVVYLLLFPLSFRSLIKTISPHNLFLSYLIFPFTYNIIFFYLGFYNNCFAIIFMLLALKYWITNEEDLNLFSNQLNPRKMQWRKRIFFIILLLLTYFSHMFIFAILLFIISIQILIKATMNAKTFSIIIKKSTTLILLSIFPLIFIFFYFHSRKSTGEIDYMKFKEQLFWLKNLVITYDEDPVFVGILFYSFSILLISAFAYRINSARQLRKANGTINLFLSFKNSIIISDFYLISSILLLMLYFIIPDGDGVAGYVTLRLGLLFFIIVSIWIASHNLPKWLSIVIISIILVCHFKLNIDRMDTVKSLNSIAVDITKLSQQIEPNSIVLPLNYSDNPHFVHFSSYIGVEKPIIILDNYECSRGWFPLLWNLKSMPSTMIGNINSEQPCIYPHGKGNNPPVKIDYVFILGNIDLRTDSCNEMIKKSIVDNYNLIPNNSDLMKLYKLK